MITLRIKKTEFDLIKIGSKKTDWRAPSIYNKKLLLSKNENGLFCENRDIKEIQFINGYSLNSPSLIAEILLIRPVKFTKDIVIAEDNFTAHEGECSIEIKLGNIKII